MSESDSVFTYEAVPLKFGMGATEEVGSDLRRLGVRRALLVTDPHLLSLGLPDRVAGDIRAAGLEVEVFGRVQSEPTKQSWLDAIECATESDVDGFVAVGGGSTIDTAKAANLYSTHPADLSDYINKPMGEGRPVPGPLRPLVAVPTTAGTASECTTVAILGLEELKVKTGVSHRFLRPSYAILDPLNTVSCSQLVTASCGIDVLCHAAESYTAIPYDRRPKPASPEQRPPYVGANPVSDLWTAKAIELTASFLPRAVRDGEDLEARSAMMLACTYAGMGFGNAGVHIPHAMGYPIAGMVRSYIPPTYPDPHPMVPHGISVTIGAPAAFRFTGAACPEKHLQVAALMGVDTTGAARDQGGAVLANAVARLMREVGIPNGISELGFGESDLEALTEGTMKQQRLLAQSPCPVGQRDVEELFRNSLRYW